jgi:hypothetical protein
VLLDRKEVKRQKDKERYASMSREQKDELNRKARERRVEKKIHDKEKKCEEGTCMDENAPNGSQDQGTVSYFIYYSTSSSFHAVSFTMMMDPSEAGDSSTPFADVTNTTNQGSHLHFELLK